MMVTSSHGFYFDGRTATKHAVTVTVMGDGLRIAREDGEVIWWPYDEIRQAQRVHADERVALERGHPIAEILGIEDEAMLAAIERLAPATKRHFRQPLRRSTWLTVALLAGIGAVVLGSALYLWGIPAFADAVTSRVPVVWEERIGQRAMDDVGMFGERCTDAERLGMIDHVVSRLRSGIPSTPYAFHVTVLASPSVNALAAPGGYIVVFHGLLTKTRSPEDLAGVLAHEMQHVVQRHGTRALVRKQSMSVLISALSGDGRGLASALNAAGTLGQLRYSRRDEDSADREGMKMLQAARIDPRGMVEVFRTLQREAGAASSVPAYLQSHPPVSARIETLQRMATQAHYIPVPLLPTYPWREIDNVCPPSTQR